MTQALAEKSWTVALRAPTAEKLEISVYDIIGDSFFGDGVSAKDVLAKLSAAPKATEITLRVNSVGGVVDDAKAMINLLAERRAQGAKVLGFVDGIAASSASYLLTVCDHVTVASNAFVMFHQARTGRMGNAREMAETADMLTRVNDQLAEGYATASARRGKNKPKTAFLEAMDRGDTYLDADQAIEWGLADAKSEPLKAVAALADINGLESAPDALRGAAYVASARQAAPVISVSVSSPIDAKALAAAVQAAVEQALEPETTPDPVVQDDPKPSPTTGKEDPIMAFPKSILTVLALDESATEEAIVSAIVALKSEPQTNAAASRVGLEIERIVGAVGAEAIGAVRALKADQERLVTVSAELAQTKASLSRNAFDTAIKSGRDAKKLTPHATKDFTARFDAALAKGESGDDVVSELQGFIRLAAPFATEARQVATPGEGGLLYNGKTYAQMTFRERGKLADSDPDLWRQMKTDFEATQH